MSFLSAGGGGVVPYTSTGFYDADLLHDLMVLSRIELNVENIPVIYKVLRMIKGKTLTRIRTLEVISKHSGYPIPSNLIGTLRNLIRSLDKQEIALQNYVKGLLASQAYIRKMAMKATRIRMERMLKLTRDRVEGLRKQLYDSDEARDAFLSAVVQKRLAQGQGG